MTASVCVRTYTHIHTCHFANAFIQSDFQLVHSTSEGDLGFSILPNGTSAWAEISCRPSGWRTTALHSWRQLKVKLSWNTSATQAPRSLTIHYTSSIWMKWAEKTHGHRGIFFFSSFNSPVFFYCCSPLFCSVSVIISACIFLCKNWHQVRVSNTA